MVRLFDNLPDDDHVPYKFLTAEPHLKDVVRYMRPSDYAVWAAVGAGFPAAHWMWERAKPSFHPKVMPRVMAIQIPAYACIGFVFAATHSLFRFWGWRENGPEAARWAEESKTRPQSTKKWGENDW
ncbi:hypothetical protein HDU85_001094 [Gaertneriomyces sp. JEL0708]|nr:NADH-ubiquinone oxidoreductase complex I, 21 kDa subunit-domain-containing protein [Gaertneriomyces semiglobifer]KAJ3185735.1 hypothetical protein HDU85_001094 [Gaertneriomyces sp. JEL0708]